MRDAPSPGGRAGVLDRSRSWLLRNLLLPLGDRAFGQRMMARLKMLEEAQWWDAGRVAAERDALLRRTVEVAYREVPFWRDHMDAAGVRPADVRSVADLPRIPWVGKPELRAGYPERVTRPTGQRTYVNSTSGSTGSNFQVVEDPETAGWYRATFLLMLEWAGWEIGTPHLQMGMTLSRSLDRRIKDRLLRCHYVSAFDLRPGDLDRALELLERERIDFIFGYPGSLHALAERAREQGWNRPLKAAVTWGDNVQEVYRREILEVFGARLYDTYGIGEGMHVAAQCEHGRYHRHMLDCVSELLDADGRPVPPGTAGEVVLTRLHPGPMPLIRYRVGDLAVPSAEAACPCGRAWELLDSIQGRDTDIVVTPSGNRLLVEFFCGLLDDVPEVHEFQVVQEEADSILLRIVPRPGFDAAVAGRIVRDFQAHGADLDVHVETVAEIPLPPTGKRRFVTSPYARRLREARAAAAPALQGKNG
ncbi:MAG TPA: AMP-binding protein [Longimicrobium sp.]|nr:AMP-binding protein [Longimicrobium sp.]